MKDDFGDFEELDEKGQVVSSSTPDGEGENTRVRLPRAGEFIGVVVQRFGGNKMEVKCTDGKLRNSRVPGRFKRSMWLRPRDYVIVKPWEFDDGKADIIYQYRPNQAAQLRKLKKVDGLDQEF